jgi:acyl-CoA synthetase (AMP-forming)/AMP-acid ligase II
LRQEAIAISARLRRAGLERGDNVAFLMDNGLFTVQLFLGTMCSGLVTVPLNVRAGLDQLAYTFDHSDAKILFIEDQYAAVAREALAAVSRSLQVITADAAAFATDETVPLDDAPSQPLGGDDVALLMYTSGSVGLPKAAIDSHRTILAHGRNSMGSHCLTSVDRSLLAAAALPY